MSRNARRAAAIVAAIAWAAVLGQLALSVAGAPAETPGWLAALRLYGYFTIWSNTLVALVTTAVALGRGGLLTRPGTLAATVVYIVVVGVVYNTLLIRLNPQVGWGKVVDTMLHSVVPLVYTLWWLVLVPRGRLGWRALPPALVFPIAYSAVALTRGAMTGKYAYFFIDIARFGLPVVLVNIAGLAALYAVLMAGLIAFDRRTVERRSA